MIGDATVTVRKRRRLMGAAVAAVNSGATTVGEVAKMIGCDGLDAKATLRKAVIRGLIARRSFGVYARTDAVDKPIGEMRCIVCGLTKGIDAFGEYVFTKGGQTGRRRRRACDPCRSERERSRYRDSADVRERTKKRTATIHASNRYGLTRREILQMHESQGGHCAICDRIKPLCVDHDHETGRVRELLCRSCNLGIGFLGDDPATLVAAVAYLTRHAAISGTHTAVRPGIEPPDGGAP